MEASRKTPLPHVQPSDRGGTGSDALRETPPSSTEANRGRAALSKNWRILASFRSVSTRGPGGLPLRSWPDRADPVVTRSFPRVSRERRPFFFTTLVKEGGRGT